MLISAVVILGVLYYSAWIPCPEMVVHLSFLWIMSTLPARVSYLIARCSTGCIDDDLSLFNINQIRDLKLNPKSQAPWNKSLKNRDKISYKVPNSIKKGATYRIQQPRAASVM